MSGMAERPEIDVKFFEMLAAVVAPFVRTLPPLSPVVCPRCKVSKLGVKTGVKGIDRVECPSCGWRPRKWRPKCPY
jgi:hypothetical protein